MARGAPASRNLAINKANGAFVTGLDDDDEFLPERIGAFVDYWRLLNDRGERPACLFAQDIIVRKGERLITQRRSNVTVDDLFELNAPQTKSSHRKHIIRRSDYSMSNYPRGKT